MVNQRVVRSTVHWLLTALVIVYLITGFGITEYRIVEPLTFGLLTKSLGTENPYKYRNPLHNPASTAYLAPAAVEILQIENARA